MNHSPTRFVDFLDSLELPPAFESREPEPGDMPSFTDAPQAIAVGAHLTEFTANVPADLRAALSDSLLLAQLAAKKAASKVGASPDVFAWYEKYIEVLEGIGWRIVAFERQSQQVAADSADVHSAIVPVIAAMLGAGVVTAGSMVLSLLEGLQKMDESRKWITLFDRASQHAHGANFQVSHVDAPDGIDPVIRVMCFTIDARRAITQVLFFKFSDSAATLSKAGGTFAAERTRLLETHKAIGERVKPYIAEYVANVDI